MGTERINNKYSGDLRDDESILRKIFEQIHHGYCSLGTLIALGFLVTLGRLIKVKGTHALVNVAPSDDAG